MSLFAQLGVAPEIVEPVPVQFGEWLPDLPAMNNPGAIEALNVIPAEGGYVPFADFSALAPALPSAVKGAGAAYVDQYTANVYAGVGDGIYGKRGPAPFTRLYTAPSAITVPDYWQFVEFGAQMVALHTQVAPVATNVGGFAAFSPLGGNPPTAGCGTRFGDFLLLGNLSVDPDDGDDAFPSRIRWSGFNNIDAPWVTDPATQADFQDLPAEGGPVVGMTAREFGLVFQTRYISRMTYVGLPTVFDIETVEENRGALSRDCIVSFGPVDFAIDESGFFMWNGTNAQPISDNKVNRYFFNKLNYGERERIVGAVDYVNGCIMWAFPTGLSPELGEIIIYSMRENRWSHSIQFVEYLLSSAKPGISLEDLTGNLDTDYTISFDSGYYKGGRAALAAFKSQVYGQFTGPNMAAQIDTGEFGGPGGRRVVANNARPLVDLSAAVGTIQVAQRDELYGEDLVWGPEVSQERDGVCPIEADARLARFRLSLPAGASWRHATGIEVWRKVGGA